MQASDATPDRRRGLLVGAGVAVVLAAGLSTMILPGRRPVAPPPDAPPVFDAEWTRLPTPQDVERVYPAKPRAERYAHRVVVSMRCLITEAGGLTDCAITHESISGLGFGQAALALADRFTLKTQAPDGSSLVGLPVTVPMGFSPIFAEPPPAPRPNEAIS